MLFQPQCSKRENWLSKGQIWPSRRIRVTEVFMENGPQLMPTRTVSRLALALATTALALGCATQKSSSTPSWPEQPSPSYPNPLAEAKPTAPPETLDEPQTHEQPMGAPSSSLAKEYNGKKALETLSGKATYYADSLAGNHTANGDVYDPKKFTAAHKKLPFGTVVRVVREDNGAVTYARINDRGPFGPKDRIIDLSKAAAKELDMMKAGVVGVRVEIVQRPKK